MANRFSTQFPTLNTGARGGLNLDMVRNPPAAGLAYTPGVTGAAIPGAQPPSFSQGIDLGMSPQAGGGYDMGIDTGALGDVDTSKGGGSGWSWFGGKDAAGDPTNSYLGAGLNIAKGAFDAYLGYKELKVAEDTLSFQKDAFSKQFENQRSLTNTQLRDRQIARRSANKGHQAVDAYMAEHGI